MSTASARDVRFFKCGRKALVKAPGRSVNLDGDGKRPEEERRECRYRDSGHYSKTV